MFQEHIIPDELVRQAELESTVLRLRRENVCSAQRGYTNMIVFVGGEGPSEE